MSIISKNDIGEDTKLCKLNYINIDTMEYVEYASIKLANIKLANMSIQYSLKELLVLLFK